MCIFLKYLLLTRPAKNPTWVCCHRLGVFLAKSDPDLWKTSSSKVHLHLQSIKTIQVAVLTETNILFSLIVGTSLSSKVIAINGFVVKTVTLPAIHGTWNRFETTWSRLANHPVPMICLSARCRYASPRYGRVTSDSACMLHKWKLRQLYCNKLIAAGRFIISMPY